MNLKTMSDIVAPISNAKNISAWGSFTMAHVKHFAGILTLAALFSCSNSKNTSDSGQFMKTNSTGIIGGSTVQPGTQLAASIVGVYDRTHGGLCTGSLLNNSLVVTAAHCVSAGGQILVVFTTDFSQKPAPEMVRAVTGIKIHPSYGRALKPGPDGKSYDNADIALIRFSGSAPTGYVPAKLLNDPYALRAGADVVLAGFGISDGVKQTGAGLLRTTTVQVSDPQWGVTEVLLDQQQGHGACHGDSGGPAYVFLDGQFYLFGITSRGQDDPKNDCSHFSIYTNVLWHYEFLKSAGTALVGG